MDPRLPAITELLSLYLDEADPTALDQACALAGTGPLDIAALLDWLRQVPADAGRKRQATLTLRRTLRLPLIPGPVCRPAGP
jgi:hypothetical protein